MLWTCFANRKQLVSKNYNYFHLVHWTNRWLNVENVYLFFTNYWLLDNRNSKKLRTAFRRRVKLECHLVFFFLSRRTHRKLSFCDAMISRMENQKIFVETQDENIDIESPPSVFWSLVEGFVSLQRTGQKGNFCFWTLFFFAFRDN